MGKEISVKKFALGDVDRRLGETYWSPIDVVHINDWVLRASALKGEFHWHKHNDDELFLIYKGEIVIETENGPLTLKEGEVAVIPKGLKHKPGTGAGQYQRRLTGKAFVFLGLSDPVHHPILDRLADVGRADIGLPGQVRNGPRHLEDSVISPGAKAELGDGGLQ
jgi:uncharacterized cupin superfamily protein